MGKDNPHAFPISRPYNHQTGMTLRDYFAGQALGSVLILCQGDTDARKDYPKYCAGRAYDIADAMLAHRKDESDA